MMEIVRQDGGWRGVAVGYDFVATRVGQALVATCSRGICLVAFGAGEDELRRRFSGAVLKAGTLDVEAAAAVASWPDASRPVRVCVAGTDFQFAVWRALLEVSFGELRTYGDIACQVGRPQAFRAVGSAVGANPVALLIPCHRIVPSGGRSIGGYHWGAELKRKLIALERQNFS